MSDKMQGSEVTMLDMIERERKQQERAFAAEQERDQLRADLATAESKLSEYAGWSPDQFLRYQAKHQELQERYLQKDTQRFNAETAPSGVLIERDEARDQLATERTARESLEKELRNVSMSARRGLRRYRDNAKVVEDLGHIVRFCEQAGIVPSILRDDAAHDASLTAPLERRVGELERALRAALDRIQRQQLESACNVIGVALASTPREGTEEPEEKIMIEHLDSGMIGMEIAEDLCQGQGFIDPYSIYASKPAERPADPPADREQVRKEAEAFRLLRDNPAHSRMAAAALERVETIRTILDAAELRRLAAGGWSGNV